MIDNMAASIIASGTGLGHTPTRQSLEAETQKIFEDTQKVSPVPIIYGAKREIIESNEERIADRIIKKRGKKKEYVCASGIGISGTLQVPKTYNAKGEIIGYNESGRHFNTKA